MAENKTATQPELDGVDKRTAASKRISGLLAQRAELTAENSHLKQRVASLEHTISVMANDSSLPHNEIKRRIIEGIAGEMARRDVAAHHKKIGEFRDKVIAKLGNFKPHPDAAKVGLPDHVVNILLEHPDGPDIAAHFARNPEAVTEILAKPAHLHGAHIGEIAANLKQKREPVHSRAPHAIEGVGQGKGSLNQKDPGDMDMQEYREYRRAGGR